jgi:hypothetical protein
MLVWSLTGWQPMASAASASWSVVFSPSPGGERNTLNDVAAVSDTDAWAVGYFTDNASTGPDYTLIEHWDGTAWTQVPSPSPFGAQNILSGIVALSSKNAWAVGTGLDSFTSGVPEVTLIEHWNGSRWTVVPSPSPGATYSLLTGVGRIGTSSHLWAVGVYDVTPLGPPHPLIEQWNGTTWQLIAVPRPLRGGALEGISPTSRSSDDWAVGESCSATGCDETLAEHWNGSSWNVVSSPNPGPGSLADVSQVPGSNKAWAVGTWVNTAQGYLNQGFTERWNGSSWALIQPAAPAPNMGFSFRDVLAAGTTSAWTVGSYLASSGLQELTLIEAWDGTSWTIVTSPNQGTGSNYLYGVARVPGTTHAWAVGEYFNASNSFGGSLIERYA